MRLAIEMLTLKPEPALLLRLEHDVEEMNALIWRRHVMTGDTTAAAK